VEWWKTPGKNMLDATLSEKWEHLCTPSRPDLLSLCLRNLPCSLSHAYHDPWLSEWPGSTSCAASYRPLWKEKLMWCSFYRHRR
jgi:hypothetical protein